VNDWKWEYLPDDELVVGGLPGMLRAELEQIAQRLADAADVKYLGDPPVEESGVSGVLDFAEGPWMVWYQEHRRLRTVFILRQQHLFA
jgi:hypothetical protein